MSGSEVQAAVVDDDAAARARAPGRTRAPVRRADGCRRRTRSCRFPDGCRRRTRMRWRAGLAVDDLQRVLAGVHGHAQRLDLRAQHARRRRRRPAPPSAAARIRPRGSAGFMSRRALAHSRPSRPPPITTPLRGALAAFAHRFQVFDGAVDEAVRAVLARQRRHEGVGAGGHHQLVVGQHFAVGDGDGLRGAVDGRGARVQLEQQVVAVEEAWRDQRQVVGRFARRRTRTGARGRRRGAALRTAP